MTIAKALTGGYFPMGATLLSGEIAEAIEENKDNFGILGHGYTNSGNPVGAAAASVAAAVLVLAVALVLIDELDRADEEFEAFLLEILSDYQISIPEIGTIKAKVQPVVVITSNRTREVHDALKRRCLYHWIGYPSAKQEFEIIKCRIPDISISLGKQIVSFVQAIRKRELYKSPGVAETLDWSNALIKLGTTELSKEITKDTLGTLLKYQDDIESMDSETTKGLIQKAFTDSNFI